MSQVCAQSPRGGDQPGGSVGSAVHLLQGVSVRMCHRGGQGRGGLCMGGGEERRIYMLVWLRRRNRASHPREPGYRQLSGRQCMRTPARATSQGAGSLGGKPGTRGSPSAPLLCPGWMLLSPCEMISSFALFSMLGWRVAEAGGALRFLS